MKAEEQKLYTFRGKTFPCNPKTIQKLNLALAYNQSKERYEEVESSATSESGKSKRSN